jgi:dipeptidyl-peptidase 4
MFDFPKNPHGIPVIVLFPLLALLTHLAAAQPTPAFPHPSQQYYDDLRSNAGVHTNYPAESRWLDGGNRYTVLEPAASDPKALDLVAYDTASGARTILVPAGKLTPQGSSAALVVDDYAWSADGSELLIFTNTQRVWRLHTRGDYWVLHLSDGKLTKLGGDGPPATMMFAKFSPDGTQVAYVRANNIYVQSLADGSIKQITTDGSTDIINGTTDWVTEEEFDLRDAFRWSPDSKSIAYWQFDQSGVEEYTLINDTDAEYPKVFKYKYPHPGGTNAAVRVGVIPAAGGATTWIKLNGDPRNNYIPRMDWVGDSNQIVLQYLNRLQNDDKVMLADAATGETHMLFEDTDKAWVDFMPSFEWLAGKDNHSGAGSRNEDLLWLSERDGWRHAYLISRSTGQPRLITNFAGDVIDPILLDTTNGYFYFLASPDDLIRQYLYRSRLDGSGTPERVNPADEPGVHFYNVSPNGRWAIHSFSNASHPPRFELAEIDSRKVIRTLVTNDTLVAKENAIDPEPVEFTETTVGGGVKLSTWVVKPPNFDPSKKYPMLVYVYGEPAATTVKDTWGFQQFKVIAREGYVVVSFDNAGTPQPRGRDWRKSIYGAIGVLSSQQQSEAIDSFARTHSYIDTSRMGMWGHSGGGSMTLNMMFRHPGQLVAAVSLAPVADEALYDSIYQERYMGLPQQNVKGYHDGSPINFASGLAGHLLIIHGSGDDNVHYQGTERLINQLVALGKPFDFMDYPNRTHALSEGQGTFLHRQVLLMRYFEDYIVPGPR